jgi:hypothetical protein
MVHARRAKICQRGQRMREFLGIPVSRGWLGQEQIRIKIRSKSRSKSRILRIHPDLGADQAKLPRPSHWGYRSGQAEAGGVRVVGCISDVGCISISAMRLRSPYVYPGAFRPRRPHAPYVSETEKGPGGDGAAISRNERCPPQSAPGPGEDPFLAICGLPPIRLRDHPGGLKRFVTNDRYACSALGLPTSDSEPAPCDE